MELYKKNRRNTINISQIYQRTILENQYKLFALKRLLAKKITSLIF